MSEILDRQHGVDAGRLKESIRKNRMSMAKAQFDLISNIERMRVTMPEDDLRAFLVVECGVAKSDVSPLLSFRRLLGKHEPLLREKAIPFHVVRAMISTDSETRELAVDAIAAGDHVDLPKISALRRRIVRQRVGANVLAERSRSRALSKAASIYSLKKIDAFSVKVAELLEEIDNFVDCFIPPATDDPDDLLPETSETFRAAKTGIELRAVDVLGEFQGIFGDVNAPDGNLTAGRNGTHIQRLAAAARSLDLFARGKFAWDGGFAFATGCLFSTEIQDALEYLLPLEVTADPSENTASVSKPLEFVEICAGAGGQAIGLLEAGFKPTALYELNLSATKTLGKNWRWPIRRKNLLKVTSEELRKRHYGVDLLSGGVECKAYSRVGKQRGPQDDRNLFDEAVRFVEAIKPRAFFFENVEGFKAEKFADYRAEVYRKLTQAGYNVEFHHLNAQHFGLAQARQRIILVGIKNTEDGKFFKPLAHPHGVNMSDVLRDVLFPNLNKGDAIYDDWANNWLEHKGQTASPAVLSNLYKAHPNIIRNWAKAGFRIDQAHLADEPVKTESVFDPRNLPYLTIDVVKALQGFPRAWEFAGSPTQQFMQIGNAFPPLMSKAVGLSIARALAGAFDVSSDQPPISLFDESRIGLPAPKRSIRLNTPSVEDYLNFERIHEEELERHIRDNNKEMARASRQHLKIARAETRKVIKALEQMRRDRAAAISVHVSVLERLPQTLTT